jgi:ribonuclease HI
MTSKETQLKDVTIYTDGGCEPNPGPGGYGVILISGKARKELSGGFCLTTNNRMEIFAAIAGLEALKFPCKVRLHSDSRYLVDAMTQGWVLKWQAKGWRRNKKQKARNIDLWERLLALCEQHQVWFEWVKGHAGHDLNERCDELAMTALKRPNLPVDEGYEQCSAENNAGKITQEGQACRKCSTPVIKRVPRRKLKPGQTYYFEYYLSCPNCDAMYMVEEAKRYVETQTFL